MNEVLWLLNMYERGMLADQLQSKIGNFVEDRTRALGLEGLHGYRIYLGSNPPEITHWEPYLQQTGLGETLLQQKTAAFAPPWPHDAYPSAQSSNSDHEWLSLIEQLGEITTWTFFFDQGLTHVSGPLAAPILHALDPTHPLDSVLEFVEKEDRGRVAKAMHAVMQEGKTQEMSYRVQLPNGEIRSLKDRIKPVFDAEGRTRGLVGVKIDLTEMAEAQQRLEESEQRYRRLVETIQVPIVIHQDDQIVFANRAALDAIGANYPEQFVGQAMTNFVLDPNHGSWAPEPNTIYRGLPTVTPYESELQLRRLDGKLIYTKSGAVPIEYQGRPAVLLYFLDITEQRKTLNLLMNSQLRLDLSQEIAQVGAWEYDYGSGSVWWSDTLYKLLGLSKEDFPTTKDGFMALIHPEDVPLVEHHLQQTEVHGTPCKFDHRIIRPNGELRYFHVNGYLFRDEEGVPERLIGATHDITERKLREEEIQQLNQTLERRVSQRTAALKASNDELRRFAYSVSHDLRAPLRHLMSYSQLLMKNHQGGLDELGQEFLGFISQAAHRMDALVSGLLVYSRVGQHALEPSWIYSDKMIREIWPTLLTAEQRAQVELQIDELPAVYADAFLLEQVWANLLSNAIKYSSRQAQPHIHIQGHIVDRHVTFQITDNGVGFDMRDSGRLFMLFQRLPSSQGFDGTGIGLANAKRIVDRHHGEIWAKSTLNGGATFFVKLPRLGPTPEASL